MLGSHTLMRLNYKLSAALVIVSSAPVAMMVVALQQRGFDHLLAERGTLYRAEADAMVRSLTLTVNGEADKLRSFCDVSVVVSQQVALTNLAAMQTPEKDRQAREQYLDKAWPDMRPTDEPVSAVLNNPLAKQLRAYQLNTPLADEILITDRFGRVIASTEKTTDYIQADESWWHTGASLKPGEIWFDDLHYDESAEVYSLDMVFPVFGDDGGFTGVLKAVFNVSPLFSSIPPPATGRADQIDIVRDDGAVLARVNQPDYTPLSMSIPAPLMDMVRDDDLNRWFLSPVNHSDKQRMIGVACVAFANANHNTQHIFVLVSTPADTVTVPIRSAIQNFLVGTAIVLVLFLFGAVMYVRIRITKPLELLRDGTRSISLSAKLRKDHGPVTSHQHAYKVVDSLHNIHTGDEIEELASSFAVMGSRVLRYHRHLESEVAEKTELIHQDLEMAKEFQQAMLPDHYPTVPMGQPITGHQHSLHFWHIYQPAATLGGDFFDMFQISEHRAGLFVADVMGHGARSALVTAILRALLSGIVEAAADPSEFMSQLNRHFIDIMDRSDQTIFVTAFFMVMDTKDQTATYVTAGHPSPVYANRRTGEASLLIESIHRQPALGLIKDAHYTTHSRPLSKGDVFMIYTDGLTEAENHEGAMFGEESLIDSIRRNLQLPINQLSHEIVAELARFTHNQPMADDLCLVVAEVDGMHST
jgi:sigma-B regulation protein RsbU (phosphoserine phosphatase)